MARYMTSSELIASVKRRAMLPSTQVTFTDDDFLAFANEEMDMALIPYVLAFHQDYFLNHVKVPLVESQSEYQIPYRAIGNKLRDVAHEVGHIVYEMTRITKTDEPYYQFSAGAVVGTGLKVFYIEGNNIVLVPKLSYGGAVHGELVISYYLRPNALVSESRAMTIQSIDPTTGIITVNAVPNIFTVGANVDLIKTQSPSTTYAYDIPLLNIDAVANTIQIDPTLIPRFLAVGDYICLAEESIIPQIPTDLHSMLAQRVACRCLEALGDQQGLASANQKLQEMEFKAGTIVDSRVEDAPLKVLNRHGFLRTTRRYVRR